MQSSFQIGLHQKDKAVLEQIKKFFDGAAGNIKKSGAELLQFRVKSVKDIQVILNHFDRYPLITQKRADYELFKKIVLMMSKKEHLTPEGLRKIVALKALMNRGLSDELKAAFPNTFPIERSLIKNLAIPNPQWVAGFTSGEGCWMVKIKKSITYKLKEGIQLEFKLSQHSRDEELMRSLIDYWNCGNVYKDRDAIDFRIQKFSDLIEKVIPFFQKYTIMGVKAKDFDDFCKVADLMKKKAHLTVEGLDQIRKIKRGMNRGRNKII